jgi:hypothetical protein
MESSVGAEVTHSVQAATASGRACPSPDRRNHRRATTLATYEFYDEQTSGKSFRPNRATRRSRDGHALPHGDSRLPDSIMVSLPPWRSHRRLGFDRLTAVLECSDRSIKSKPSDSIE